MPKNYRLAKSLVWLLENRFQVGPLKFGLDPVLGLVPGLGDLISAGLGIYLIYLGHQLHLPSHTLRRMVGNLIVDLALGALPLVGDAADFLFRSNYLNWRLLQENLPPKIEEGEILS